MAELPDERAVAIRRSVLFRVRDRGADLCVWYRPGPDGRPVAWGATHDVGDPRRWPNSMLFPAAHLRRPGRDGLRGFAATERKFLGRSAARLLIYQRGELLAVLIALREAPNHFAAKELLRLQSSVRALRASFAQAARIEGKCWPSGQGDLVLSAAGDVLAATDTGRQWLATHAARTALAELSGRLPTGRAAAGEQCANGLALRWTPMRGPGRRGWLTRVARARVLHLAPDAALSPMQRAVAELAAGGMPVALISARLHRSAGTIRSHIKSVYSRLGVSNRAELTLALDTRTQGTDSIAPAPSTRKRS